MKTTFNLILLIALIVLSTAPSSTFAAPDTLVVAALPPGNLNAVINADTLVGGITHPNRVYVLAQTGLVDTVYFITSPIRVTNLTLIGKTNPHTGHPPVIEPFINTDNSSPGNYIEALAGATVTCKNIYFLGTRTDGASVTPQAISANGDSITFKFDHCIIEHIGETSTPNIFNTWNAAHCKIYVTNCILRNNQSDVPQNPGCNWADPPVTPYPVDTAIYANNTLFIIGGCVEGSGQDVGYFQFDHNTIFMQTKSAPFTLQQQQNSVITNNIFFGANASGLDSSTLNTPASKNANFYTPLPPIIALDTLSSFKNAPFNKTEADRRIVVTNNAYFWPAKILSNFAVINSDAVYLARNLGPVSRPVWKSSWISDIFTNKTTWPLINVPDNSNLNVDPGFDAALVSMASDSMAAFVNACWRQGSGQGARPFVYRTDPSNIYGGVAANWSATQNYPVRENLRYTNATLLTASTTGGPIGDLNWFPEQHPLGVAMTSQSAPANFSLSQNYPNPFNPTTVIEYVLPRNGFVTLKVFNVLGQEVATLVNQEQKPGVYNVSFDASRLASGFYMYRIQSGDFTSTKKMLLLK